ncbi:MAG TPA: NfeD family protein, partial [Candidatus Angelobacter sp.]|nr:NfeD family protein [Candidatus Angelobacter sp.]
QIDGKTITRFDGSKTTLHVAYQPVRLLPMTMREQILSALMDPNFTLILLAVGAFCVYFEFNHPGAVIPGAVGFVAILLGIYALDMLPFRTISLVLILAAFVFFALEAKFQTHGVLAITGSVMLILGSLLLVNGPIPQMRVKWWTALSVSIPLALITVFLMAIALKARRNKVVLGEEGLIGEIGTVRSALTPAGKVFVRGELWNAVANANIEIGKPVVIRRVKDLVLHVEQAAQSAPAAPKS